MFIPDFILDSSVESGINMEILSPDLSRTWPEAVDDAARTMRPKKVPNCHNEGFVNVVFGLLGQQTSTSVHYFRY